MIKNYRSKLLQAINTEKEIEKLELEIKEMCLSGFFEPVRVVEYLKNNNFVIDPKLIELAQERGIIEDEITKKIQRNIKTNEENEGSFCRSRFRHVVACLKEESNKSTSDLEKEINLVQGTLNKLIERGDLRSCDYIKICNYFELPIDYAPWRRCVYDL